MSWATCSVQNKSFILHPYILYFIQKENSSLCQKHALGVWGTLTLRTYICRAWACYWVMYFFRLAWIFRAFLKSQQTGKRQKCLSVSHNLNVKCTILSSDIGYLWLCLNGECVDIAVLGHVCMVQPDPGFFYSIAINRL